MVWHEMQVSDDASVHAGAALAPCTAPNVKLPWQ
jgi:hypothetical protein